MNTSTRKDFDTIDAFRFFAFFKVFLLHAPSSGDFPLFNYIKRGGGIGVVFFFVLSGFLITHMLTREKMSNGTIALRVFFGKRILRIWPLFYLLLFLMYFTPAALLEHCGLRYTGGYEPDWRFSFAFLENYRMILAHQGPKLGPLLVTWSLCIEEHFYIIWGIVIAFASVRLIPYAMMLLICIGISARIAVVHLLPGYDVTTNEILTSLDYFAAGGIAGYMVAAQRQYLDKILGAIPRYMQWSYLCFIIIYVFAHDDMLAWVHVSPYIRDTIHSVLFAALIALVIPDSSPIRIGRSNVFSYLGRISYGLYLFHLPVILVWLTVCNRHHIKIDTPLSIFLSFIGIFSISVVLASVLYFYFEKPILKLKRYL